MSNTPRRFLAALLFLLLCPWSWALSDAPKLVILHINDTHGHLTSAGMDGPVGGAARLATLVEGIRDENPGKVLLLHAGDILSKGDAVTVHYAGEANFRAMNRLGYDVLTPGNGDFYWGLDNLLRCRRIAAFPVIHAGVAYKDGKKPIFKPHTIIDVSGLRVGVFGLGAIWLEHPLARDLMLHDSVEAARRCIAELRETCDLVVLLSHLGDEGDRAVASQVSGLHLIVGGHTHDLMDVPERLASPGEPGEAYYVRAGSYGRWLGRLDIEIEETPEGARLAEVAAKLIPIDEAVPEHPDVAGMLEEFRRPLEEVICNAETRLPNTEKEAYAAARFVAEAMRAAANADVALLDRGAIRADIGPRRITLADLYRIHPCRNRVLTLQLTPAQIEAALAEGELVAAGWPREGISGRRATYTTVVGEYAQGITEALKDVPAEDTGHRVDTILRQYLQVHGVPSSP